MALLSLNACLLPSHFRWIFRLHRGTEGLEEATERVIRVLTTLVRRHDVRVLHLQEVYEVESYNMLKASLHSAGLTHATPFTACGLCSFTARSAEKLFITEFPHPVFRPKGWLSIQNGDTIYVNVHLASEIDGGHLARRAQAKTIFDWMCTQKTAVSRVVVAGDLNEGDGEGYFAVADALGARPAVAQPHTYRWLGGLVSKRLDRAYVFRDEDGRLSRGEEVVGEVLPAEEDVSDHLPLLVHVSGDCAAS